MRAVRLFGASAALMAALSSSINAGPADTLFGRVQLVADAAEAAARASLGQEAFAAAWEQGKALSLEEAFTLAVG